MSEKMHKDICFYSNRENYSKKILNLISQQKKDNDFVFICVDDRNIKLPNFLRVVPTIFLVKEQKILTDEDIEEFLKPKQEKSNNENSFEELDAFFDSSNSFSSHYSNIDDSLNTNVNSSFSFLDGSNSVSPSNQETGLENSRNGVTNSFEKLQQERANDFQGIKRV